MGYIAVWKVLEEMITDFRKKGLEIPSEVMGDLKNAKITMEIFKAETSRSESMQKIEDYLRNVETYLVSEGQRKLGFDYVDKWLDRVDSASREIADEGQKETRFIPGLPRVLKWIRVASSEELPLEELRTVADEMSLTYTVQKDGCLLVYGEDQGIKDFVKKMASKHSLETGKYRKRVRNR